MSYIDFLKSLSEKSGFKPSILKQNRPDLFRHYSIESTGDFKFPAFSIVNLHNDCRLCRYGFQIDVWQGYCPHGCVYCWAKWTGSASDENRVKPFDLLSFWYCLESVSEKESILGAESKSVKESSSDESDIYNIANQIMESPNLKRDFQLIKELLEKKVPLRIGSFYDSFIKEEEEFKLTASVIEILNHYNYPYLIVTKSSLPAESPWCDLIRPDLAVFQMSISVSDETISQKLEPGAPLIDERFKALKKIGKKGVYTCVRMNPMFPWSSDFTQGVEDKEKKTKKEIFKSMDIGLIEKACENKVRGILAGVLNFNPEYSDRIFRVLTKEWQLPTIYSRSGLDINKQDIRKYYHELSQACKKRQINFSTCYLGYPEEHYSDFSDLWTNKECFCSVNLDYEAENDKSTQYGESGKGQEVKKETSPGKLKHSNRSAVVEITEQFRSNLEREGEKGFLARTAEKLALKIIELIVRLAGPKKNK